MAELKTKKNNASVIDFIGRVENEQRRTDAHELLAMFQRATGLEAAMWGTSIIGFGSYHYTSERSSQEGDWPLVGFSPRKQNLTLYAVNGFQIHDALLQKLGTHTTGVGCLYIKKLDDIDRVVLEELVHTSYVVAKERYT